MSYQADRRALSLTFPSLSVILSTEVARCPRLTRHYGTGPEVAAGPGARRRCERTSRPQVARSCLLSVWSPVKGQRDFPLGGQLISSRADRLCPGLRTA